MTYNSFVEFIPKHFKNFDAISRWTYFPNVIFGLFIAGVHKDNFVDSISFSIYKITSSSNRDIFTPFFPIWTLFFSFSCIITLIALEICPFQMNHEILETGTLSYLSSHIPRLGSRT